MLSVVMPSYNDAHSLKLTLRSLVRQTLPADQFEVVLVCDGPADGYEEIEEHAQGLDLRITTLPQRAGRSAARNAGLALATGRIVVFLDSDCYADPRLLSRHYAFHDGQTSQRVLLGVRHDIDLPEFGFLLRGEPIPADLLTPLVRDVRFQGAVEADIPECMETPWLFAHTNNASVPADVLTAIGGFNEEFGTRWGWEDLEIFYRVYKHLGSDVRSFECDTGAVCYHLPQYRDAMHDYMDFFQNQTVVKRLHPHYEFEFHTLRLPVTVAAKVRYYREVIRGCVEAKTCRLRPVWEWVEPRLAAGGTRVLWIGMGTGEIPIGDSALTFDYEAPVSDRNFHLIGTATPLPDATLDAVVSVDFWRCLQWEDFCGFLREATRIAPSALLVRSANARLPHRPVSTAAELDFLTHALAHEFDVTMDGDDEITGITVRRKAAAVS